MSAVSSCFPTTGNMARSALRFERLRHSFVRDSAYHFPQPITLIGPAWRCPGRFQESMSVRPDFRFPPVPHLQINKIVLGRLLGISTRLAVQGC